MVIQQNSRKLLMMDILIACNTDTTPTQPHWNSNTHRTKNNMTNVAIQQNSCKLLMMDILMSKTCWAHKKWNKIASDIKLVFYSSTTEWMYSNFIINTFKGMYSLHLTCCSSYSLSLYGLPYSEYYPFICILYIWHVAAATLCPCMAYHILNTTHTFVQQLLFAPLWPTIFWTLPVQFYNNCSLSMNGLPYTEHCPLSFTYAFYVISMVAIFQLHICKNM